MFNYLTQLVLSMETFTFQKVDFDDKELMQQIYQLRFRVYCYECGFINEADYPDQIERDEYDPQSVHFAALNEHQEVIGTMRLILNGDLFMPLEHHCKDIRIDQGDVPRDKIAEISRLVISKDLRRRKKDELYYEPQVSDESVKNKENHVFLRRAKPMAFGLYREVYRESLMRDIIHWYALMEKSLWLLLHIHGFTFDAVGAEVDVYGPVKPYLGRVDKIKEEVKKKFPGFFDYFAEGA